MIGDQAINLRKLASSPTVDMEEEMLIWRHNPRFRTIAITGGKGGVGKTNLAANLGVALSQIGNRVIIFDADLGLANIDVFFNLHPKYNLKHVVSGEKEIHEILVEGPAGVMIVPASSGVEMMANLPRKDRMRLLVKLGELSTMADLMIIDTAAGISHNTLTFASAADVAVIVTTPDPAAITDTYATIKLISRRKKGPFKLIVNMARDESQAKEVALSLILVVQKFLNLQLDYIGFIPLDPIVSKALKRQVSLILEYPGALASRYIMAIACRLASMFKGSRRSSKSSDFFRRVSESLDEAVPDKEAEDESPELEVWDQSSG